METKTKKTLLISSIILLIAINISALSTIYIRSKIQVKRSTEIQNMREEARVGGMHRFIKEELKLSDEQFELFKDLSKTNMIELHNITLKLNDKRIDMMDEIAKINPNPEVLDDIAKDIGALHYELKKTTINHFLDLKKICKDDQQKDLQRLFMQIINDQDQGNPRRNQRKQGRNQGEPVRNRGRNPQGRN